jgi:CheY-like chemotaxis protein
MRILAVDDEPFILELMPLLTAKVGFPDVTTFSSGPLALDALMNGENVFDCLLLDVNMPGMDGIELCSRVRQLEGYRKTPIIMLTAMSERDYMDSAFKAGATDYATKPIDINELGARLRIAEELSKAWRQAEAARETVTAPGPTRNHKHGFDLSDAISVEGMKDILSLGAMKNYLRQCSRAGLAASQVIAAKIDGVEAIYARATTEEFTYALCEVADAIIEALRTKNCMMAYAGDGTFVVVCNSAAPITPDEIEAEVQGLLDERHVQYDTGDPLDIEVSIGNPIQPNFSDIADTSKSLERAIARAESRSAMKRDQPATVSIRRDFP